MDIPDKWFQGINKTGPFLFQVSSDANLSIPFQNDYQELLNSEASWGWQLSVTVFLNLCILSAPFSTQTSDCQFDKKIAIWVRDYPPGDWHTFQKILPNMEPMTLADDSLYSLYLFARQCIDIVKGN